MKCWPSSWKPRWITPCPARPKGLKSSPPSSVMMPALPAARCWPASTSRKRTPATEEAQCNMPDQPPRLPSPVRRAVIDVGTNSVKLLVADVSGLHVEPLVELSQQTRLGRGFYQTRRLQTPAITDTARAVAGFAAKALEAGAVVTR